MRSCRFPSGHAAQFYLPPEEVAAGEAYVCVCALTLSHMSSTSGPAASVRVRVHVRSGSGIESKSEMNNIGRLKVQRSVIEMINPNFRRK